MSKGIDGAGRIDGAGALALSSGVLLTYSGLRGFSVLKGIQNVVTGKNPNTGQSTSLLYPGDNTSGNFTVGPGQLLTSPQIEKLWQQAGGPASTARNAACHAMQESGGNPEVTSSNPDGGTNVGLWQLDTPGGVGAGHSIAELKDPMTNARITVHATNGGRNWSKWSTPGC